MGFKEAIYQNVNIFGTMTHAYLMASIHGIFPCPMLSNSVISYVIPLLDLHEAPNNIVLLSMTNRVVGGMTG